MGRDAEDEALRAHGLGQLADDVALRAHLRRAPVGERAVVHREAVVVLGDRHHVPRARLLEQRRPLRGVESLGRERRDEVLVAERRLRPVGGHVVRELRRALLVHVARIPLVAERGHRVEAPMDEDAELAVLVPRRHGEVLQRLPVRRERSLGDGGVDVTPGWQR